MITMNISPPRPIELSSAATVPNVNPRRRKRLTRNIGSATRVSTITKTTSSATPPMIAVSTDGLVHPMECVPYGWIPYVIPTSTEISPTANRTFPHQSTRERFTMPVSRNLRYAHAVPNNPTGTETRNTRCQSVVLSNPPTISPMNDPDTAATALIPSAMPRSRCGNASVRMAVEQAKIIAPPTPWISRKRISSSAALGPVVNTSDRRIDPTVKTRNPRLYNRTRPNMSPIRPRLTTSTAVTTMYPMIIQSR
jgi:hypothetical protein